MVSALKYMSAHLLVAYILPSFHRTRRSPVWRTQQEFVRCSVVRSVLLIRSSSLERNALGRVPCNVHHSMPPGPGPVRGCVAELDYQSHRAQCGQAPIGLPEAWDLLQARSSQRRNVSGGHNSIELCRSRNVHTSTTHSLQRFGCIFSRTSWRAHVCVIVPFLYVKFE